MASTWKELNEHVEDSARQILRDELEKLPADMQKVFKWMYGRKCTKRGDPTRSVEDAELLTIAEVVAEVPIEKLEVAMQQVAASFRKLEKQAAAKV